jgi:hypothetical protein
MIACCVRRRGGDYRQGVQTPFLHTQSTKKERKITIGYTNV